VPEDSIGPVLLGDGGHQRRVIELPLDVVEPQQGLAFRGDGSDLLPALGIVVG